MVKALSLLLRSNLELVSRYSFNSLIGLRESFCPILILKFGTLVSFQVFGFTEHFVDCSIVYKAARARWPGLFQGVDSALEEWIVDQMHIVNLSSFLLFSLQSSDFERM